MKLLSSVFLLFSALFLAQNKPEKNINIGFNAKVINENLIEAKLTNLSKDTLKFVLMEEGLRIVQEAMDKDGKWKPIEYWEVPKDFFYDRITVLPQNGYIDPISRKKGNFKTKVRLKLLFEGKNFYSKPFDESIDPEAFQLKGFRENPKYAGFIKMFGEEYVKKFATLDAVVFAELPKKVRERK